MRETALQIELLQNLSLWRADTKLKAEDRRAVQKYTKTKTNLPIYQQTCLTATCLYVVWHHFKQVKNIAKCGKKVKQIRTFPHEVTISAFSHVTFPTVPALVIIREYIQCCLDAITALLFLLVGNVLLTSSRVLPAFLAECYQFYLSCIIPDVLNPVFIRKVQHTVLLWFPRRRQDIVFPLLLS